MGTANVAAAVAAAFEGLVQGYLVNTSEAILDAVVEFVATLDSLGIRSTAKSVNDTQKAAETQANLYLAEAIGGINY